MLRRTEQESHSEWDRPCAEAETRRTAEEEERTRVAAEAEARRQAEEAARAAAEAEARRKAEEEERTRVAAEAEARRQTEEAARAAAEAEARRRAEEEERTRVAAEAEARRQTEEAARAAAEAEARRKAEEEERTRVAAEVEARRQTEEAARAAAEAEARRKAEEEERARVAAEAETRRQTEEAARAAAEAEARRNAAEAPHRTNAEDGEAEARSPAAEGEAQTGDGRASAAEADEPGSARRASAPRYRAPGGGPPAPRNPAGNAAKRAEPVTGGNHALQVELRILFERGDSVCVSLLPKRTSGLPDELSVCTASGIIDLVARQDDWYQDVVPQNLGALLRDGVLWRYEATDQEWLLSGREIFVLASGTAHRGLVSCPRFVLGREHALLCTAERLAAVEAVLRQAGCDGWTQLDENDGAPIGWLVLRGVIPRRPVPSADGADILNVLRPLPAFEIALEGGVCLGYTSWLAEHPPSIRVYGDPEHVGTVLIDGQNATSSEDGRYVAPGWDSAGAHQVWCSGATRTYSLVRCDLPVQAWRAFTFPTPGTRIRGRIAICGPLVRALADPATDGEDAATSEIIQVRPANPVLLGSLPGEVVVAHSRSDVRGAQCIVSSPFAPVWALPAQPLLCDKSANRVLLVGEPLAPGGGSGDTSATASRLSIQLWCSAIGDAGRKGLAVEPATPAVADLWRRYRRYARDLWRRSR